MNAFPIADAHVHLWDLKRAPYLWLRAFPTLHKTHTIEDFDRAVADTSVATIVFVECTVAFDDAKSRDEVEWVASLAEEDARIKGMIAHASLERGADAREHLAWLAEQPLVKGTRRLLQDEPSDFFQRPGLVEGVQLLGEFDFTFDLTVRAPQLPQTIELVDQCPEVDFVLDHMGKPNIREGNIEPWKTHLAELAERPNVACKISGVLTEADPEAWRPEDIAPYVQHTIACFGPDRILYGGDWPVLRLAADYTTWCDLARQAVADLPLSDQRKFFRTNAERIYGL